MASIRTLIVFLIVVLLFILMFGRDINPRPCVSALYQDDPFAEVC